MVFSEVTIFSIPFNNASGKKEILSMNSSTKNEEKSGICSKLKLSRNLLSLNFGKQPVETKYLTFILLVLYKKSVSLGARVKSNTHKLHTHTIKVARAGIEPAFPP